MNLFVKNVDGKPIFATHLIICEISNLIRQIKMTIQVENNDSGDDCIVCYERDEVAQIIKILKDLNVEYNIQLLKKPFIDETVIYQSREEIVESIIAGKKPKFKKEIDSDDDLNKLKKQMNAIMDKLNIKY